MASLDTSLFFSYSIVADPSLSKGTFRYSVTPPPGDPRTFTCFLYDGNGKNISDLATGSGTTTSSPTATNLFSGNTIKAHLNYLESGNPDVVVPLVFADNVEIGLSQQQLKFVWSGQSVTVLSPPRPLVELDPGGSPIVLSYDIPEPAGYRGRQIIEMDFPLSYFMTAQQAADQAKMDVKNSPTTTASSTYADDQGTRAADLPTNRPRPSSLTPVQISSAFDLAKKTGQFNPEVFPNISTGSNARTLDGVRDALRDLTAETVVAQMDANKRLVIYRDTSGRYMYKFIDEPISASPSLLLVEYYRLSSFPARYGAGRTIKTFSLLPGEKTTIRINTYKRSETTVSQASSILDSTTADTESEFEQTVLAEQSTQDASSRGFEYHAEAAAEGKASWGWGSASVSASGGVKGTTNASREEFAKNISNAVSQNAARASSRREVQIDTSLDVKLEEGEEQAVERELSNVNVSRTLNFVFRQMNQEYLTLLHLVDVRVAFFNGYAESRMEVPLPELGDLLNNYIVQEQRSNVLKAISNELTSITDYTGKVRGDFIQTQTLTGDAGQTMSYLRVNPDAFSTYAPAPDSPAVTVPGVILAADTRVMRTDGVVVDTFLGLGNGLDDYSTGLQQEAVRSRQIDNNRAQTEVDRVNLGLQIIRSANTAAAALYQQIFPTPATVNQIDHAVINSPTTSATNLLETPADNRTAQTTAR